MIEKVSWGKDSDALPETGGKVLEVARDQTLSTSCDCDFHECGVIRIGKRRGKWRCGNENASMGNVIEQRRYEFSVKLEARTAQHLRVLGEQAGIQAQRQFSR